MYPILKRKKKTKNKTKKQHYMIFLKIWKNKTKLWQKNKKNQQNKVMYII